MPGCGGGSSTPPVQTGDGYTGTDDRLLEESRKWFSVFLGASGFSNGSGQRSGIGAGNDSRTISSIAATGFGLTALCIGDRRGYQPHSAIVSRVQATLNFLANTMQPMGKNGFFTISWIRLQVPGV